MKYIIYKTTCSVNNKIYIGVHLTEDPNIFDGYLGRGFYKTHTTYLKHPESPLHYAIIKYGVDNFKREVLFVFEREEDAYKKEEELVNLDFIAREDTYNVALGGKLNHKPSRKVYLFDFEGNLIHKYENALAASKINNVSLSNINDAIIHKRTSANSLWSDSEYINILQYTITKSNTYYLYNSYGIFVQEFKSSSECVKFLNSNTANLTRAIKLHNKIKGYFISTEKLEKFIITKSNLKGMLNRYTLDGKYIDSFSSAEDARKKLGLKLCSISLAIKLNRQCNGFRWTRTDTPTQIISCPS